jgi:hypothetical protein
MTAALVLQRVCHECRNGTLIGRIARSRQKSHNLRQARDFLLEFADFFVSLCVDVYKNRTKIRLLRNQIIFE